VILRRKKFKKVFLPAFGRMTITPGQEKVLDELWSKAVKVVAGFKCERCGNTEQLQSHHAVGKRRNKTLRHVVSNGFCLCAGHHMGAEQNGIEFAVWAIKKRGQQWWDDLQVQGRSVKQWKEFSLIKKYLESFIHG
jgi:hypothetical protein